MKSLVQIPENLDIKFLNINKKFFFFFANLYCLVPKEFFFSFSNNTLFFFCKNILLKKEFYKFISLFIKLLKKSYNPFVKKLILKGLGLKVNFSGDLNYLDLKLGFSHLIKIKIPKEKLNIKLLKNSILIGGSNLVTIGNFIYKIRSLKFPNIYKGKGIWYKNEKKILKPIKKN